MTPVLPVSDLDRSTDFYTSAGFDVERYEGGGFAFVSYDGESVFDLNSPDGFDVAANRSGCFLVVPDADLWRQRLAIAGLAVTEMADQPWGMREFTLTDPDGNYLRIGQSIEG